MCGLAKLANPAEGDCAPFMQENRAFEPIISRTMEVGWRLLNPRPHALPFHAATRARHRRAHRVADGKIEAGHADQDDNTSCIDRKESNAYA